jgi:hypothetical protein
MAKTIHTSSNPRDLVEARTFWGEGHTGKSQIDHASLEEIKDADQKAHACPPQRGNHGKQTQ